MKAKPRAEAGRMAVKRLRAGGAIPAVVYGAHRQPMSIAVASKDLEKVLHQATGENVLVDLLVEENGKTNNRLALIQEVQHHPVDDIILHVDFHEVSATEKLRTAVPVRAVGEPAGVKEGGVLEYVMRELHVECLPKDLPDVIEVDVTKLVIGQGIHVEDIAPPAGVMLLDQKDQSVFIVVAPIAEEEVVAAAAEAVEPELIGAKAEEGEEAAVESEAKPKPEAGKPATAGKPAAAGKAEAAKGAAPAGKPATAGKAEAKSAAGGKPAPAGKPAPGAGKPEAKK